MKHVKIYLPCNFKVIPITHVGVISLVSSHFQNFNTFRPLFQKLSEIDVKFKLQKCSACQENVRQLCEELFLLKCIFFADFHCFWLLK
jgi:hypothetical protein